MSERDEYEALCDAYYDWVGDAADTYRRALEELAASDCTEVLRKAPHLPAIPAPDAGPWAVLRWLEEYATARKYDFPHLSDELLSVSWTLWENELDNSGLPAFAENIHAFATRLALLEARPYYELPPEAERVHDEFFHESFGGSIAEAEAVEGIVVDAFLRDLEVAAAELQRRAEWHHAEAERLETLAAEARNRGEHTEAAELEETAARHTEAGREAAAHAAALRRYCRQARRVPPPAYRRPRPRTLCGHRVRTSAAPLAPNAPPTRSTRVRCAATAA